MHFIHLADLHIGKRVNEFSMIEDQRYVLEQVLQLADWQMADGKGLDGVLIAGDVYDKPVPAAEAVQLLDWFLTQLANRKLPIYMVSGNHDSGERLAFGAHLLRTSGVYVESVYDGTLHSVTLEDAYGKLHIYMLPFIKPVNVRRALLQEEQSVKDESDAIATYQDAVAAVLERAEIQKNDRNILLAHQMVTGAKRCDSEEIYVGGLDNIDAELFDDFDYVALGHLHGPQKAGREEVRYAGTLLKYSFSECAHKKSVTILEMREKGNISIETIPVKPLRDMRQIEGTYEQLMSRDFYKNSNTEDYLKVILKDEEEVTDALGKLRTVYPNIMKLQYDNERTRFTQHVEDADWKEDKQPQTYFEEFFEVQNNQPMTEEQKKLVTDLIERIWG
ncbi:MAG: exonuclease SbcCD subunit D [Clostridium sp.]|nr:exonuclease SbcCD subunit D [Clostridium sp.]